MPRGQFEHGKQEKVFGADSHSTKQILQLPITKNAEQEFLQVLLCSWVTHGFVFLLPCPKDQQGFVYQLRQVRFVVLTRNPVLCFSPSHKSSILSLHKKWNINYILFFYFSILRNKSFWYIGPRIEIDKWNIGHGRRESLKMWLLAGERLVTNQTSGD